MSSSLQRRRSAALPRPVMTPVWRPAVTARVRPWPSWASKFLISSALPSDCESSVTLPSVSVPSTSINRTLMRLARFLTTGVALPGVRAKGFSSAEISCLRPKLKSLRSRLDQLQRPQIVQMHHAEDAVRFIHNDDRGDFFLFHQIQGLAGEHVRPNRLRIPGHPIHGAHFE